MNKMWIPILFALGTAFFWGCYGPAIGNAQNPVVDGKPLPIGAGGWSPYKSYVFIGLAYLVIAVIGGLIMMKVKGDSFSYAGTQFPTAKWGFLAGCLGALGALMLTSAMMTSKGNAMLVMPIVFGGAVTITAIVSVIRLGGFSGISPLLWIGMALTLCGVVLTAMNTPHGHAKHAKSTAAKHDHAPATATADQRSTASDKSSKPSAT
jgi:uncharacterized membrane protein